MISFTFRPGLFSRAAGFDGVYLRVGSIAAAEEPAVAGGKGHVLHHYAKIRSAGNKAAIHQVGYNALSRVHRNGEAYAFNVFAAGL